MPIIVDEDALVQGQQRSEVLGGLTCALAPFRLTWPVSCDSRHTFRGRHGKRRWRR